MLFRSVGASNHSKQSVNVASLPLVVPHYPLIPALRQKLTALAHRSQVQARDVFDLFALAGGTTHHLNLAELRADLSDTILREVRARALDLPQAAYVDNVLAFLDEEHRTRWMDRWDEQCVFVADLADALLSLPGDGSAA